MNGRTDSRSRRRLLKAIFLSLAIGPIAAPALIFAAGDAGSGLNGPILDASPQYPRLFDGYRVRPPWRVAGVDYAVGVPTGTKLVDPLALDLPGVEINKDKHQIFVNSNNPVTLSGVDFSRDGGWQLIIGTQIASDYVSVTKSYFAVGSNGNAMVHQVNGANVDFSYDTFDGNSRSDDLSGCAFFLNGGMTLKYSLIKNIFADFIDYGYDNTVVSNLFEDDGQGPGTHPDWLQIGTGAYTNQTFRFNTFIQRAAKIGPGTQGIGLQGDAPWSVVRASFSNNTMIALPGARINHFFGIDVSGVAGSIAIHDNFLDPRGSSQFMRIDGAGFRDLQRNGRVSISGNVNMLNGEVIK